MIGSTETVINERHMVIELNAFDPHLFSIQNKYKPTQKQKHKETNIHKHTNNKNRSKLERGCFI